jgi:organic radical activating enzyme
MNNTNRRIFRGCGGANDRRLPKFNARRRKHVKQKAESSTVEDDGDDTVEIIILKDDDEDDEDDDDDDNDEYNEDGKMVKCVEKADNEEERVQDYHGTSTSIRSAEHAARSNVSQPPTTSHDVATIITTITTNKDEDGGEPWQQNEITHLLMRTKNLRASILLLSANDDGISNTATTYQENVLNPVANNVNEWGSIVQNYYSATNSATTITDATITAATLMDPVVLKNTSLAIFDLLQLSLQCGPLAGARPGYFKYCGGEVAIVVDQYLFQMFPNDENGVHDRMRMRNLGFTNKQVRAIQMWQKYALKAVDKHYLHLHSTTNVVSQPPPADDNKDDEPWQKEILHLLKRVKNLRVSIQFSANGICNVTTYQKNVLNAVSNSVNEWGSIVRHYDSSNTITSTTLDAPQVLKNTCSAVFEILQLSLQCGPLAGARPGYFKRCGGEVASVVVHYLFQMFADEHAVRALQFTDKQVIAIEMWRKNAIKEAENNQPPSKSAQKKMEITSKTASKKKKK